MSSAFDAHAAHYRDTLDRATGHGSVHFADRKARIAAQRAGRDFSGRVLDFGCGVGLLAGRLAARLPKARVDGYDPSVASVAEVPADLREAGTFTDRLEGLEPGYDLITVANVFHHVPVPDRAVVAASLAALLAPGGRALVFEHNPANPLTRRLVDRCPFDADAVLLPPAETVGLLSDAGLGQVSGRYTVFFPQFLGFLARAERALGWLPLGAQYVVEGRRG